MYWLVLIITAAGCPQCIGGGVGTSIPRGGFETLEQCEDAGRQSQNNVVSSLDGVTPSISFTCTPNYWEIKRQQKGSNNG